ncbi:MAG: hypothetical protein QF441_01065 [Bacteriovoracaceae bacterium]|jgi:hypothetical protein|nr:hypothetical protein [Halobacteriovoraceae bacterium]MDP7319160.1 hypothetical protein [Bacteriovoracaceae bacterium]
MKNIFLSLILILNSSFVFAQKQAVNDNKPVEEYSQDDFETIKLDRLRRLRRELVKLNNEMGGLKKELKQDLDMVTRIQTESKLENLKTEYEKTRYLFIETITNINLNSVQLKKSKTTFAEDIKQILDPALNTFKKISEKPRQVQEYNEMMEKLQVQYADSIKAKARLELFLDENKKSPLRWKVREAIKTTEKLINELKVKREDLQFKILKIEENEESIVSTFSTIIFDFIKTKGKNLILALIVFLAFFWAFKIGQARFIDLVLYKVSRSESKDMYNWIIRPTKVIYNVCSTLIAFFMSILTLYVLNDWVLVTIILIVFAALVWSSKQHLPMFMEQSKIILNLGSVREGERVMFNGLPWQIESLGYHCKLVNPYLSGASLRINTKELLTAHSRRNEDHEPWFPTQKNDWVEVENYFGKVIFQSPEQVILEMLGGEKKYYTATNFYQLSPKNHSKGFAIDFVFGVDYVHQKILFEKVIPYFRERLKRDLFQKHPEIQGKVSDFEIEFLQAGSSSLDLRFFMKCSGEIAALKLRLTRSIQAEFVQVCNEHDIIIPFNQVTVHMSQPHE